MTGFITSSAQVLFSYTELMITFFVPPADWDTEIGVKGSFSEMTLGYNEYFLLADNRKSSDDSRLWGPVHSEEIAAKVLLCYFPVKNFRLF